MIQMNRIFLVVWIYIYFNLLDTDDSCVLCKDREKIWNVLSLAFCRYLSDVFMFIILSAYRWILFLYAIKINHYNRHFSNEPSSIHYMYLTAVQRYDRIEKLFFSFCEYAFRILGIQEVKLFFQRRICKYFTFKCL